MKEMEIGQIVDYVEEYNIIHDPDRHKHKDKEDPVIYRDATQADWDAFFG